MNNRSHFIYSSLAVAIATVLNGGLAFASKPVTPIKHVIVVVGENVTFDTLYGAYQPPKGQTIKNLLSMGIIKADGTPGANYANAIQREGFNPNDQYTVKPIIGSAYPSLPQPLQIGILTPSFQFL